MLKYTKLIMVCCAVLLVAVACSNLQEQPKLAKPFSESPTFGSSAREILPEAVPVGFLREDEHLYYGTVDGEFVDTFPMELTAETVMRGQQLFEAFCAPCHGYSGNGDGVVIQEGFSRPNSFHINQVREKTVGEYFHVITNGQNTMFNYAARIETEDRWAVAAYIRTLQISQNASYDDLPAELQAEFDAATASEE